MRYSGFGGVVSTSALQGASALVRVYSGPATEHVELDPPMVTTEREADAARAQAMLDEIARIDGADRIYVDDAMIDALTYRTRIRRKPLRRLLMTGRVQSDGSAKLHAVADGRADFTMFLDEQERPLFYVEGLAGYAPEMTIVAA